MTPLRRLLAAVSGAGFFACSALPSAAAPFAATAQARAVVAGIARSVTPARDLGRRASSARISGAIELRYNHEPELDALVEQQSTATSPVFQHYLTSAQFDAYFAPTVAQHAYVIARLRAAGLRITQTSPNRTVVDFAGSSADAERFFGTEIHSFAQSGYGPRFANVRSATVSADLAPLVRSVTLSDFVIARVRPRAAGIALGNVRTAGVAGPMRRLVKPGRFVVSGPASLAKSHAATNAVKDSGFESGAVGNGWRRCQTATSSRSANISSVKPDTGSYAGFAGSTGTAEQLGYSGICQLVTIPSSGAILSADLYRTSNETDATYAAQDVFLVSPSLGIVAIVQSTVANDGAYESQSWDLSNFAGRQLYLYFGVHGDGAASLSTQQYVDNVSLVSGTPSGSLPVVVPNVDTAACAGTAESGPLAVQSSGYTAHLPTGVAKAFDFPVQHGCDGTGETAAIVIAGIAKQSDVDSFMNTAGVTQTGKLVTIPVDNGGVSRPDDDGEATLDAETIVGAEPAATVNLYSMNELTVAQITDTYNRVVSDNTAVAANSSFGGCENDFGQYDEQYDAIFVQGAALGITFVGTSGDSGSFECYDGPNNANSEGVSSNNSPHAVSLGSIDFTQDASTGALTGIQGSNQNATFSFPSGGGVSKLYALPRYQAGIAGVITSGRNQPDLALPGDTDYEYQGGQAEITGGTSWSGPLFTALLTGAAQLHQTRGFGFANPMIYNIFRATGYAHAFIDSTTGNNTPSGGAGDYQAAAGYDQVTGIGVPKGYTFAVEL